MSAVAEPVAAARELRLALGYACALAAASLFAVGGVIAKLAFAAGLTPSELAQLRALFAFLVFVALVGALRRRDLRVRRADLPLLGLFGVFGLGAIQWSYYEAIGRLPLGVALAIQYTGTLLMLLWARLTGRRVGRRLWLAAALAIGGAFFVVGAYDSALRAVNAAGAAIAFLAAGIFAAYFLLAERILRRYSVWTLLVYGFGFASIAWSVVRPLPTLPWAAIDAPTAGLVAGVVVVGSVVPFALILAAVSMVPAARVGLVSTFEPVVGALAAWLVLSETLELPQLIGGALVMAGIAIAQSLRPTADSA